MILKKKIKDVDLKLEIVENYIKTNTLDNKIKTEYLIFNLDSIPFELSVSKYVGKITTYVLSSNWKIIFGCYDFQEVVSLLENTELLVKLAKGKIC